ncbi:ferredoxin, partial [Rhizobium sp. BUS002]|nr:ferredoxin [Rhizobium phaseoli]
MPTIHYILKDGTTREVDAKVGASVMETAIR